MRSRSIVFLVVGIVCSHRGLALDMAPIDWSGRIGLLLRTNQLEQGDDTFHQAYTAELIGRSFVWEPWFGDWRARLAATKSLTDSTTDQDSTILSGDGELNLFPRSRFPFKAFFDVQDTRIDISDSERPGDDSRFVRYGMRQRYQSPVGDLYDATLLRDQREHLETGRRDTSNRAILSAFLQRGVHKINSSFLANATRREAGDFAEDANVTSLGDSDQLDWQLDVTDTYSPNQRLSVVTTGTLGYRDAEIASRSTERSEARLISQLLWRAEDIPLRVQGNFFSEARRTETDGAEDRDRGEVRGIVNLTYLPTPRWRLGLELGARTRAGDADETSTVQTGTIDYSSLAIPLGQFDYAYGASAGASNRTSSAEDAEQLYRGNLLHNLNRRWLFSWGAPVTMGLSLGQEGRGERSTLLGNLATLQHRLSWSLSSQSSSAQLLIQDTRDSGRSDLVLQTLSLNGVYNRRLSRFSDFAANYNVNLTRQSGGVLPDEELDDGEDPEPDLATLNNPDDTRRDKTTNLEVSYRHNRVFRVRNLWFQSRLRLSADSLLVSDFAGSEDDDGELLWENRLEYSLGKLEVRFRTALIERSGDNNGNILAALSVNRYF